VAEYAEASICFRPDPESEITIALGATGGLSATLGALGRPGDRVVIIEPFHEKYPEQVRLFGMEPVFVPLHHDSVRGHWQVDWEKLERAAAAGVRALILNSPHNPTGKVFDKAELFRLAALSRAHDFVVVADEIYAHLVYDGRHHCPAALNKDMRARTIVVSSISSRCATGWRIGWVIAPPHYTEALRAVAAAPQTLPEVLRRAAHEFDGERIIHVRADDSERRQSYAELLREAECVWGGLQRVGIARGDKVLFQLEHSEEILPAFWGCLLGGAVPVIAARPLSYDESSRPLEQLCHLWDLLEHPLVVTDEEHCENLRSGLQRRLSEELKVETIEKLLASTPRQEEMPVAAGDAAFYSTTSGSTGAPKCIVLTHANLLARARGTNQLCDHSIDDIILNWLPFDPVTSG